MKIKKERKLKLQKKEAYEKALKEGRTDELEKQWQEKFQDVERRAGEAEKKYQDRLLSVAKKQRSALASEISSIGTKSGKKALKMLIESRIKIDAETGEETFFK